jgi:hypothetical protein
LINVTPEQTSFVIHRFKKKKFCDINWLLEIFNLTTISVNFHYLK